MMAKFVFTGGRDYKDSYTLIDIVDHLNIKENEVVVGCCRTGLDAMVRKLFPNATVYQADWTNKGRAAGPLRNIQMVESNPGAMVLAFPGGRGTEHCVQEALKRKLIVLRIENRF